MGFSSRVYNKNPVFPTNVRAQDGIAEQIGKLFTQLSVLCPA